MSEPAVRQAAAMAVHWDRGDIEAAVLMLAEISTKEEAEDLVVALLHLRGRSTEELLKLVQRV